MEQILENDDLNGKVYDVVYHTVDAMLRVSHYGSNELMDDWIELARSNSGKHIPDKTYRGMHHLIYRHLVQDENPKILYIPAKLVDEETQYRLIDGFSPGKKNIEILADEIMGKYGNILLGKYQNCHNIE